MRKLRADQPPGPRGRWPVGNMYDYDQDRIGFLRRNQAEYGDVFSFSRNTVVVCDPELIHEIFQHSNETFVAEDQVLASARDRARSLENIDGWMRSRRLGWQGMTRAVIRAHGLRVVSAFDDALRATGGDDFDVVSVMREYSGRMVADFIFGAGADDVVEITNLRATLAVPFMNNSLTIPKWLPTPKVRRAVKAEDDVQATIGARVARRRAEPHDEPEDLLDLMLAEPLTETAPTDEQISTLLGSTMLASFGSPGAALSWILLELSRKPEVYAKVRDEAVELHADSGSVIDDNRLPYSKAFVKEILRLYPPTWLMGRLVRRPYTLGGWPLRPGQDVMFSPFLVQRDPRWWSRAEELLPERWLEQSSPESRRAYFPFGSGPRVCLGMHLGLYQLVTAAAHLVANYDIDVSTSDVGASIHAILLPDGLTARVRPQVAAEVGS